MRLLLLITLSLAGCINDPRYQAVSREFRRSVEEVDFKGSATYTSDETRGYVTARFKLRDPDGSKEMKTQK